MHKGLVWLRRDLRVDDHKVIAAATQECDLVYLAFVFDENILARFVNKQDRRLSFITDALLGINKRIKIYNSQVIVTVGNPEQVIPDMAGILGVERIYAGTDYEPSNVIRDQKVVNSLAKLDISLQLICDHLIIPAEKILKNNQEPYKVFTPFAKAWRAHLSKADYQLVQPNLNKLCYPSSQELNQLETRVKLIETQQAQEILTIVGYEYQPNLSFIVEDAAVKLQEFLDNKINNYNIERNFLARNGTSLLSPYLRFGIISIRECFREANEIETNGAYAWVQELIWREFYMMILFRFPHTVNLEFQPAYQYTLKWENDPSKIKAWQEGKTGYPIIDAAMRQLNQTGWMHNRARMIAASFLTKDLLVDWKIGEEYFAQQLLDYDLSSNVGGWQWSASTGTDAQPYFRIFNPYTQSKNFDPQGEYIRTYVSELKQVEEQSIHKPSEQIIKYYGYLPPIVDHSAQRIKTLNLFKAVK
ncbi:cryptochrome/photolyase family protein [Rickettsiales endosymbiont of Stachyamoeba lipophora]|uniref:cryptochrome/photolyase family protein n=1 Tax=Rickettsiales endosymbiont of Stachyamoeba lipophora TaxID=2486578 RepID=UPI000F648962|nr:deoxyribodipyrimidine photo-lyase [Rickettsiales endosymbiont of Stachyamoeba lipophora]